jgi:hypothetical protein
VAGGVEQTVCHGWSCELRRASENGSHLRTPVATVGVDRAERERMAAADINRDSKQGVVCN